MKLRKKEMIEGVMYTGDNDTIRNFVTEKQNEFVITSLGNLCKPGDWIVKVDGECKIVKQEDFNKTYEVAE